MRVYELAKELNITSKELIKELADMGISAKNHMASVDEEAAEKIRKQRKVAKPEIKEAKAEKEEKVKKKESPEEAKSDAAAEQKEAEEDTDAEEVPAEEAEPEKDKEDLEKLEIEEGTTVKEFAELLDINPSLIIKKLMSLGEMTTINQPISHEAIEVLAEEYSYDAEIIKPREEVKTRPELKGKVVPRAPVVTVMGHVDHGKTRLLDAIRKTDVISGEAGGITQHIGAYQVEHGSKKITFLDTPGHEAFTAMRARGAKVTDCAVLVVAADEGVMPQTVEAIDHAKVADVPIVVAVNKIDKPNANPDKARKQLAEYDLAPEEWGGKNVFVPVSAKEGTNLDELLDMILLVSEMEELKASIDVMARGVAIEARLDKGRGPVATVLVEEGTLKVGDTVVCGVAHGRIRAMIDDRGNSLNEIFPGQPAEILGLSSVPQAGDEIAAVKNEKEARSIAEHRALKRRLIDQRAHKHVTLDDLYERIKEGEIQELKLIVKGDVQGSVEAIRESLEKLPQGEVRINIIHKGVGAITATDVMLAAASDAIVIGFNVRLNEKAKKMAEKEDVDARTYDVIYKVIEDIDAARKGLLKPIIEEKEMGKVEVRDTFKVPKIGVIAGCYVTEGEVKRGSDVRLIRDGVVAYKGKISSLRRFKDDVAEVKSGFECGIGLQDFQDIKKGDILEVFAVIEKPAE